MTLEQILREVKQGESINWAMAEIRRLAEKGEL